MLNRAIGWCTLQLKTKTIILTTILISLVEIKNERERSLLVIFTKIIIEYERRNIATDICIDYDGK